MSSIEEVLKLDQESEENKKVALRKRKQRKLRFILAFFVSSALLLTITPAGLQVVGNFCKANYQNKYVRTILLKTTDLLWIYGYYEETLPNYRYIYENTDERSNLELVQQSFYSISFNYYMLAQARTAKLLFLVFKARWPNANKNLLNQIDKHLKGLNPVRGSICGPAIPYWVEELADQYGCSLIVSNSQFVSESKKEKE